MIDIIKKELIEELDNYLILVNGEIIDHSTNVKNLNFTQNIEVKIIHFIDKDINIDINIGSNINVKIEEVYYEIKNNPRFTINIRIDDNSNLDYLSFKKTKDSNVNAIVNTYINGNSYINNKNLYVFSEEAKCENNLYLEKANSQINIKNVIINNSSKSQDITTNINHIANTTKSTMNSYGICKHDSVLNINSNGIIKKGASKTELKQKAKGLVLDMKSTISANPWLQIDEHDCLASHGASIGAIDEEELYYLMSRGLTKKEAEKMIISSFIYPFLIELKEGKLQDYLISWINVNI